MLDLHNSTMHRNINVTPFNINFWYRDKKKSYISYEKKPEKTTFLEVAKKYMEPNSSNTIARGLEKTVQLNR